ncbi:hypothetical protein GGF39_003976 [Coemansia sp. RSA 1721]|nr:hypothetical protein GGF39_003976 [Coemansia sp. RSA 1721]
MTNECNRQETDQSASTSSSSPSNTPAHQDRQLPKVILVVHDKTPTMRILYVSSNVRQVMKYEPADLIGQSSYQYVPSSSKDAFKQIFGSVETSIVLETSAQAYDSEGNRVIFRTIHFNCDNMGFNVSISCPHAPEQTAMSMMRTLVQKKLAVSACLVLETGGNQGPRILFASRSFSRIVGVETDEVQGLAFLTLVARRDVVRVSRFLERVFASPSVLVEQMAFVVGERVVAVEVMAAGSNEGAMLLCQMRAPEAANGNDEAGYLSLEEIISSDPETSDCADVWRSI